MPRGLLLLTGSERRLLSHPDSPSPQVILEICLQRSGLSIHSLSLGLSLAPRTFTKCMDAALSPLRQMRIRILNYLDDWLILTQSEDELLSHRSFLLSHLECLGLRVNFAKECTVPQPTDIIPGNSSRHKPNDGGSHARTCTGHSAARGLIQNWSPSPSQGISKDAGPHGLCVSGTSVGPASHVAPSVLAETTCSTPHLASRTPSCQGEPGLRSSSGPLKRPTLHKEGKSQRVITERCGCLQSAVSKHIKCKIDWKEVFG